MILRIVHAATLPGKRQGYIDFVNKDIVPALSKNPGCKFIHVAHCVQEGHENELIWVSGWDTLERTEELEETTAYSGIAEKARSFFTDRYSESGALHIHYETFADFP